MTHRWQLWLYTLFIMPGAAVVAWLNEMWVIAAIYGGLSAWWVIGEVVKWPRS